MVDHTAGCEEGGGYRAKERDDGECEISPESSRGRESKNRDKGNTRAPKRSGCAESKMLTLIELIELTTSIIHPSPDLRGAEVPHVENNEPV